MHILYMKTHIMVLVHWNKRKRLFYVYYQRGQKERWDGFNTSTDIPRITADFQCFVCGAVFTSDEDRKQHLEKEALGQLRDDETAEDIEIAKNQEELNERHPHHIWKITHNLKKWSQQIKPKDKTNRGKVDCGNDCS